MTGRYIRVAKGSIVCNRRDLMGVVGQLQALARHIENLIPDENAFDTLNRSRDFSGGFATLAEYERQLERDILEALSTRRDGHAYESLRIEGYSTEQIEAAVYRLWKRGLIDAHSTKPKMVVPSTLTTKGWARLQQVEKVLTKTEGG